MTNNWDDWKDFPNLNDGDMPSPGSITYAEMFRALNRIPALNKQLHVLEQRLAKIEKVVTPNKDAPVYLRDTRDLVFHFSGLIDRIEARLSVLEDVDTKAEEAAKKGE